MRNFLWILLTLLSLNAYADLSDLTIGVDPGHGGSDPGAVAFDLTEKALNLQTALALKTYLEADGATVIMTRQADESMTAEGSGRTELVTRARFFNSRGVDYMISVHHNAYPPNPDANGVLAYVARGVCEYRSGRMANKVVPRIMEGNGLRAMGGANGTNCPGKPGVFQWNATVVKETSMPAVLAEIAFMTHPPEAERLNDPVYLDRNGWSLYAGFVDFLGRTPRPYQAPDQAAAPLLQLPADASQGNGLALEFAWQLDDPDPAEIRFTLAQAPGYGKRDEKPAYVGDCEAKLLAEQTETLHSSDCGDLEPGQWYSWRLDLTFENGSTSDGEAWFKTGALDVTLADGSAVSGLMSFDEIPVGESAELTLQLRNSGQEEYQPHVVLEGDHFSLDSECPETLAFGAACALTLRYTPDTAGAHGALVQFYHGPEMLGNLLLEIGVQGQAVAEETPPPPVEPETPEEPQEPETPPVEPPPAPADSGFSLQLTAPLTVQVQADQVTDTYAWQTSDGQNAAGATADFTFAQAGDYEITLTVADAPATTHRFSLQQEHAVLCVANRCTVGAGNDDSCTEAALRAAIAAGSAVNFHCGTHTLTLEDELHITKDLILDGGGEQQGGRIALNGGGQTRLIRTDEHVALTLRNLTFKNGREPGNEGAGGALFAAGSNTLHIHNCRFENNDGSNGGWEGGGGAVVVKSFSTATVENSLFVGNKGLNGGAIYNLLSGLRVSRCAFLDNDTTAGAWQGGGHGGAIYVDGAGDYLDDQPGEVVITDSTFTANRAAGSGGAVFSFLYPDDSLRIADSSFHQNQVSLDNWGLAAGGALWHGNGGLELRTSTFSDNLARSQGGALWLDGSDAALLENLTFAGNRALADDAGGYGGIGGAITGNGNFTCRHCTFANNHAGLAGGAIYGNLKVTLQNSLFANNTAFNDGDPVNYYQNCAGIMADGGGNLQFPAINANYAADTPCVYEIPAADPKLQALANYGGPTRTLALAADSPAIDTGNTEHCTAGDQRGVERQGRCDSGAFEYSAQSFTGNGLGYDLHSGRSVPVMAHFIPQIRTEDGREGNYLTLSRTDTVTVRVELQTDPDHVGRGADIFVATLYTPPGSPVPMWFMRHQGEWQVWDGRLDTLLPSEHKTALQATESIGVFQGQFAQLAGVFSVYTGYRLTEGLFVFNAGEPVQFQVE